MAGRVTDVNESWGGGRDSHYAYETGGLTEKVSVDGRFDSDGGLHGRADFRL